MATISKFQDLVIWQQSKMLAVKTLLVIREKNSFLDRELVHQMIKSVISVPSNIAEGFEREGSKEFLNFLSIAKGSNGEYLTQLIISHEVGLIDDENYGIFYELSSSTGVKIKKLMKYLSESPIKGQKFNTGVKETEITYQPNNDLLDSLNKLSQ